MEEENQRDTIQDIIEKYLNQYKADKKPIEISFRKLLPELNNLERYSHLIHSYPAKLLVHIPYFFLNNKIFSKEGDVVLDPFCGTGTVLLEASLSKRIGLGSDANPLARLIARVKNTKYDCKALELKLKDILKKSRKYKKFKTPNVINIKYWYTENAIESLGKIWTAIMKIKGDQERDFFLVCLSNCARKASFADSRVSVPVKLNPNRYAKETKIHKKIEEEIRTRRNENIFLKFERVCKDNIVRFEKLSCEKKIVTAKIVSDDARFISQSLESKEKLSPESVDLIITSPPYAGAQKYIRASSLGLGWTGLAEVRDLRTLDLKNIGREQFKKQETNNIQKTNISKADTIIEQIKGIDKVRASIASNYLIEMQKALLESLRVLKNNGYLILIVGNNQICKLEFNTQEYLHDFLISKNLECKLKLIDGIKSYGLMTKRNKTADIITREYILVFQKLCDEKK